MKRPTASDVLARRFEAAWHLYSLHRANRENDLALAALRRWSRLRAALENAILADAAPLAAPPAFAFHRTDDGGAQIAVPVPRVVRRELEAGRWRLHLDGQIGTAWGTLAAATRDPDPGRQQLGRDRLFQAAREIAPLADFGQQPLERLHLSLAPFAWQNYRLAAHISGVSVDRLLAAVILCRWTDELLAPPVTGAIQGTLLHRSLHAA